jgi:Fibronectin type III domain
MNSQNKTITISVTAVRHLNTSGSAGEFLPVNFQFRLARMYSGASTCGCTNISNTLAITSADFAQGANSVTKEFSVSLLAEPGASATGSALRDNDKILFVSNSDNWSPSKQYAVIVKTPPAAPFDLQTSNNASCGTTLSWKKPAGDVSGYKIFKNEVLLQTTTGTSSEIQNLNSNTAYSFKVSAYNDIGESPKSVVHSYTTLSDIPGVSLASPINVNLIPQHYFNDSRSNVTTSCYRNNFSSNAANNFNGQPSDDIYYKFFTNYFGELQLSTCGSGISNTYLHVLSWDGTWITSNDNSGPLCAGNQASMKLEIVPGTY